ncbi:AhpC-TSA-domain-containing protein [Xylariaceae sp. FL0804]|nr:AhpC-TSA-domain-containing protein [Xylariaceae sp. FL0804]
MSQAEQLSAITAGFANAPEAVRNALAAGHEKFMTTYDASKVVKAGDPLPAFEMSDATGQTVTSESLLAKGPLLVTFYRGSWCPYCNVAVGFLQKHLADFEARGVALVAVTPELPDTSLSAAEKAGLEFPVLTDRHNALARKLNIVYDQSSARGLHAARGIDLRARNGEDTWEVPIPAALLVDQSGVVRNAHVDPDYKDRLDPRTALEWIDAMQK